jgi:hypothetical protein
MIMPAACSSLEFQKPRQACALSQWILRSDVNRLTNWRTTASAAAPQIMSRESTKAQKRDGRDLSHFELSPFRDSKNERWQQLNHCTAVEWAN